ncbi:MAG: hypothetical protein SGARI_003665, partial [Bacillariaceae sp.]
MDTDTDLNEIESLIARSMTKLSMEDREVAMEDIHGIRNNLGERGIPGKVDSTAAAGSLSQANASLMVEGEHTDAAACLQEMEALLQRSRNNAYLLAMRLNP